MIQSGRTGVLKSRPQPDPAPTGGLGRRTEDETASPGLKGLRIVILLPSLEMGGAERQALLLARHLANDQGATVQVWGLGEPGATSRACDEMGLHWCELPIPPAGARLKQLAALAGLAALLRANRTDVLLPYAPQPNVLAGTIRPLSGVKLLVWNQRSAGVTAHPGRLERWAARNTDVFVSNSQHGADYIVDALRVPSSRVHVVPNAIVLPPASASREEWRKRLNVSADAFLACMVANLTHHKDHATLLRAWRIVVDAVQPKGANAVLVLAGRFGDTHSALQSLAAELGLEEHVRFAGPVEDVAGLLHSVDLSVFSSPREGSPNGVLESMAAGLAVVATDADGIREALGPDSGEILTPTGDHQAMARAIISLIEDPRKRNVIGEANRARVEQEFGAHRSWDPMVAICRAVRDRRSAKR